MDQLIQLYFELGIKYPDIVLLFNKHGHVISESTFKGKPKTRRLTKRKHYAFIMAVAHYILFSVLVIRRGYLTLPICN